MFFGTQAQKTSDEFGIQHISTGDILREAVKNETELGLKVKDILERGDLVSDDIINKLVENKVVDMDSFILDGYPRTIEQAKFLDHALEKANKKIDAIIMIDVSEEEIVNRITNRRVCPKCGKVYNLLTLKPKKDMKCDLDGTELIQRDDDKEDTVRDRYRVYENNTEPVIEYYRKNKKIFTINGSKDITTVTKELFNILRGASSDDNN
jgi:adenylate kinase